MAGLSIEKPAFRFPVQSVLDEGHVAVRRGTLELDNRVCRDGKEPAIEEVIHSFIGIEKQHIADHENRRHRLFEFLRSDRARPPPLGCRPKGYVCATLPSLERSPLRESFPSSRI